MPPRENPTILRMAAPLVVSFYGYDASRYPRERGDAVYEALFTQADVVTSLSEHMDARLRAIANTATRKVDGDRSPKRHCGLLRDARTPR